MLRSLFSQPARAVAPPAAPPAAAPAAVAAAAPPRAGIHDVFVGRQPISGYDAGTWWAIIGLTVGAQLLGHSVFSRVLKTTSPTVVSTSILFEIVGAAVLAGLFFDEWPAAAAIPAAALIGAGVVIVVRAGSPRPEVAGVPVSE